MNITRRTDDMVKQNIILLGVPRGGTSLLTSLLHRPPEFICLSEPAHIDVLTKESRTPEDFVRGFMTFIEKIRGDLLAGMPIENRLDPKTGKLAQDYFARHARRRNGWTTDRAFEWRSESFAVPSSDFHLLIKRNAPLVAVIEHLAAQETLTVIGMLRDPVATILSWRSLDLPISQGHLYSAERISARLRAIVEEPDLLIRQVKILNWIFERIMTTLPASAVLCYEDLVDDPRRTAAAVSLTLAEPVPRLRSKNTRDEYDHSEADAIRRAIERHAPHVMDFQGGRYRR